MPRPGLLIAFGGNALNDSTNPHPDQREEFQMAERALAPVVRLVESGHDHILLTHGNGPQVGQIFLQQELTEHAIHRHVTLDVCVADSQGRIGYVLQNVFDNICTRRGVNRRSFSIVTQVVVDPDDPAFQNPTKPIGMFYKKEEVERLHRDKGWTMKADAAGRGWRRVVASPLPLEIIEQPLFAHLLTQGVVVIGAGGGGIPVVRNAQGALVGVEAVIDKDRTSALLAAELGVEALVILTQVDGVYRNFNTAQAEIISHATIGEMETLLAEGHFAEGSMRPKVEAALDFLKRGGRRVVISELNQLEQAVAGEAGTQIQT